MQDLLRLLRLIKSCLYTTHYLSLSSGLSAVEVDDVVDELDW